MNDCWALRVVEGHTLTPKMRRLTFTGSNLNKLNHEPGQSMVLLIPSKNGIPARRRYTIRKLDSKAKTMQMDFVLHHADTPAVEWALTARAGDRLDCEGPRGRIAVNKDSTWHLFSGDETGIPAISAMAETLPSHATAYIIIAVANKHEEQPILSSANLNVNWLHRGEVQQGGNQVLLDATTNFVFPPGFGSAYLIGETRIVRAQRQHLIACGFRRELIYAEGYWRKGRVGGHDHVDDEHF